MIATPRLRLCSGRSGRPRPARSSRCQLSGGDRLAEVAMEPVRRVTGRVVGELTHDAVATFHPKAEPLELIRRRVRLCATSPTSLVLGRADELAADPTTSYRLLDGEDIHDEPGPVGRANATSEETPGSWPSGRRRWRHVLSRGRRSRGHSRLTCTTPIRSVSARSARGAAWRCAPRRRGRRSTCAAGRRRGSCRGCRCAGCGARRRRALRA